MPTKGFPKPGGPNAGPRPDLGGLRTQRWLDCRCSHVEAKLQRADTDGEQIIKNQADERLISKDPAMLGAMVTFIPPAERRNGQSNQKAVIVLESGQKTKKDAAC